MIFSFRDSEQSKATTKILGEEAFLRWSYHLLINPNLQTSKKKKILQTQLLEFVKFECRFLEIKETEKGIMGLCCYDQNIQLHVHQEVDITCALEDLQRISWEFWQTRTTLYYQQIQ